MRLSRYESARDWLAHAQATLEREEAKHGLQVGIAVRLAEHPDRIKAPPYLVTVDRDDQLIAAGVMTPPHRVILFSQDTEETGPLRAIAENLIAENWAVPGVIAESAVATEFSRLWTELTGQSHQPAMSQRIYELRQVMAPQGVPGRFRAATEEDLALVVDWIEQFVVDAHLPAGAPGEAQNIAETRIPERDIFLWEVEGRPVSMAARTRHSTHGITVSLVFTPPEARRRGYASACVAALSQHLLDSGWEFCTLYTDLANPTSNAIYQQIGYVPVCDSIEYDFS